MNALEKKRKFSMHEAGYLCKGQIRSWRRGRQEIPPAPQLAAAWDLKLSRSHKGTARSAWREGSRSSGRSAPAAAMELAEVLRKEENGKRGCLYRVLSQLSAQSSAQNKFELTSKCISAEEVVQAV